MPPVNHYHSLQLSPAASAAEIKTAYRRLAKKFHPDMQQAKREAGGAVPADTQTEEDATLFRNLKEAYTILSDPESRRRHDLDLASYYGVNFLKQTRMTDSELQARFFDIHRYLKETDVHRLDYDRLYFQILIPLREAHTTGALLQSQPDMLQKIFSQLLTIASYLPLREVQALSASVRQCFGATQFMSRWDEMIRQKSTQEKSRWQLIAVILIASILITALIMRNR